ncbi:MAG: MBL fold metallo-hydrolase [Labilithrix sp.]|nr:MBL fold metallo-hydrolase [Labilithrix sp.]
MTAAVSGCFVVRAGGRAAVSLFSSPREVKKAKHPVGPDARLAVVWVGHATALVQIDDKVILTDPVFTSTVGQVSKRLVEPGIDPKDLPPVDVALVSHMHLDHLSLGSLEMIEPKVKTLLLPSGGAAYLTGGFAFPAHELATWQAWEKDGLRVTAVPVDHVGWRYGVDEAWMTESFTGYVIEYHGLKVYFGGDSAYDQRVFVETGQRFPKLDLALLPIAPIEPRSVMRRFHMDPAQAVQAFVDLDAARMVPIHYGTFVTSTDEPGDALRELAKAQKKLDLGTRVIAPLEIGERRVFVKAGEGGALPPERSFAPPASAPTPPTPAEAPPTPAIPDDDSFE